MSYQALARKYRPTSFAEVCGQQHALNSLVHALETQKVHHAYLFTGTRGVGKTTLGRLLAKCLNCKSGITADPCNTCENCIAINEGRFIDLIEIDAASRTGVEETKEILDNVQYMPSQGRYKVYLIDEVHMLSKQSFNALLKTLEEPPEYVKFILATTDHHKIPVTILSRCIQLHLKHIAQEDIKAQLLEVLKKENITSDEKSLDYIAYHAKGSMRDALSLLDQAISFCNGHLEHRKIKEMLGIIDSEEVYQIIDAIIDNDPSNILSAVKNLSLSESNSEAVLDRIAEIWFSCCVYHFTKNIDATNDISIDVIENILHKLDPEQIHFLYQLTISAKKDISLAPNFETGVTMAILRLIAFQKKNLNSSSTQRPISKTAKNVISEMKQSLAPTPNLEKPIAQKQPTEEIKPAPQPVEVPQPIAQSVKQESNTNLDTNQDIDQKWFKLLNTLKLKSFSKTFAFNSHLVSVENNNFKISINDDAKKILELDNSCIDKLQTMLSQRLGSQAKVDVINLENKPNPTKTNNLATKTPAQIKRENAVAKVNNDKNVNIIKDTLELELKDENIVLMS